VADGTFRRDLFFRLNIIAIAIPPLRERPEDIIPIFEQFIDLFNKKTGKQFTTISPEAKNLLLGYDWPGNVRELRNIMERISLLENGGEIVPKHLPFARSELPPQQPTHSQASDPLPNSLDYENATKLIIEQALEQTKGNVTRAAGILNMAPHKLRYRMKKLAIKN